jgi:hypothetical protein
VTIDARGRDMQHSRQRVGGHVEGDKEFLAKDFARMNRAQAVFNFLHDAFSMTDQFGQLAQW